MPRSTGQTGTTNRSGPSVERELPEEPERTNAVRMSVPVDPTGDSTLHLCLGEPNASQIVQEMTSIELQVIDGVRHVCLQNGTKVVPFPFMRIDGFTEQGIDQIFPSDNKIAAALRTGRLYRKEKAGEPVPRSCVSFIIPGRHDADIVLELILGRELSDKIQKDLFA